MFCLALLLLVEVTVAERAAVDSCAHRDTCEVQEETTCLLQSHLATRSLHPSGGKTPFGEFESEVAAFATVADQVVRQSYHQLTLGATQDHFEKAASDARHLEALCVVGFIICIFALVVHSAVGATRSKRDLRDKKKVRAGSSACPDSLAGRAAHPPLCTALPTSPLMSAALLPAQHDARQLVEDSAYGGALCPALVVQGSDGCFFSVPSLRRLTDITSKFECHVFGANLKPFLSLTFEWPLSDGRLSLADCERGQPLASCLCNSGPARILTVNGSTHALVVEPPESVTSSGRSFAMTSPTGKQLLHVQGMEGGRSFVFQGADKQALALAEPGIEKDGLEFFSLRVLPGVDAGLIALALICIDRLHCTILQVVD